MGGNNVHLIIVQFHLNWSWLSTSKDLNKWCTYIWSIDRLKWTLQVTCTTKEIFERNKFPKRESRLRVVFNLINMGFWIAKNCFLETVHITKWIPFITSIYSYNMKREKNRNWISERKIYVHATNKQRCVFIIRHTGGYHEKPQKIISSFSLKSVPHLLMKFYEIGSSV